MSFGCRNVSFAVVAALLCTLWHPARADQPRTRSLTYDPDRQEWVELPPPPPGTAAGDLHLIRVQITDGKTRGALSAVDGFIEKYGETDPSFPEVLIAKAEARLARRDFYKAYEVLEEFLSRFGGLALTDEALRLEFVIAETFLAGAKRKLWGIPVLSGEDVAFQILDEISAAYPESSLAELAVKTKADYLFSRGEHALAELEYTRLMRDHPQSRYHRFAMLQTGEAALASFRGVEYDEASLIEARERFSDYLARWPGSYDRERIGALLETIGEQQAEKELSIGAYYERTDHVTSAVYYYRSVIDNWPDTIAAAKATRRLELLGAVQPAADNNG